MELNETNKLIIEKSLNVPLCTCGKCPVKRGKKDHFHSLPYSSKLASMYQNDYNWKNPRVFKTDYLKATHSAMENSYRQNIPGCLVTTNKIAYKPYKVSLEGIKPKTHRVENMPFYGSTTYENTYINFGSSRIAKGLEPDNQDFKVAFRGKSMYTQDYRNHDPENYMKKDTLIHYKPTLRFVGDISGDTEFNQNYLPVDYNQPAYFGGDKLKKSDLYRSQNIPCQFPKSNFESVTRTSYVDHFQRPCRLREYLTKLNLTALEV